MPGRFFPKAALSAALLLGLAACASGQAIQLSAKNNFTATGTAYWADDLPEAQAGLAWKPELFGELWLGPELRISADLSANNRLDLAFGDNAEQGLDFSLYRAWAAASYRETELKGGLQHIRMGVAQIIRPLQWFDALPPASLLQETEGVKALTLVHFFPNPELRLWLMPSNGKAKGTELLPSPKGAWEFGGRLGAQSFLGGTGLTYHQRQVEDPFSEKAANEFRIGLDQRVDGFMGGWLEAAFSIMDRELAAPGLSGILTLPRNQLSATLGGDYTFEWGNGLYLMLEQNLRANGKTLGKLGGASLQGALLLSYPLGLLDGIQLVATADYLEQRGMATLAWRRTYDYLSWELSLGLDSGYPAKISRMPSLSLVVNYDI